MARDVVVTSSAGGCYFEALRHAEDRSAGQQRCEESVASVSRVRVTVLVWRGRSTILNLPVERTRRTVGAMAIGSIFLVGMMPVGWIFVVVTGLAPSCSDHQTDSGHPAETVDSVEATSAATNGSVVPSRDVVASTQLLPTDETTADVLAAAAAYRATESNSFGDSDYFTTVYVVERLGEADEVGFITFADTAPLITDDQRCAIEAALDPRTVVWVDGLEAVIGTEPPVTVPDRHAVVMLAEPVIEGSTGRGCHGAVVRHGVRHRLDARRRTFRERRVDRHR